ncbi:glycosyltransferase family 2 protein [Gimesia sp.]|uniref:glycosyltransferase family 2 protein n=1 Tax=Gimesia sp. TaxID=2024833 RepID=UPI0032EC408F
MDFVAAIIVTFNPDKETLHKLIDAISVQVDYVCVVDNNSPQEIKQFILGILKDNGGLVSLEENYGIASAINHGVFRAREKNASHVVLFDQDSLPEPDMVDTLLTVMNEKTRLGCHVAAVGPRYSDIKGHHAAPFVKLQGIRLRRIDCAENEIVTVDHLISSGSLISMKALEEIGLMEEDLFIDYVDTEWCLRAIHKGYQIYGVGSARMKHDLGDEYANLFGRTFPVHHPLRHYYTVRNGIWLIQQSWVSFSWKVMDFRRLFLIYLVFSFFVGKRLLNMKMLSLGVWHALIGKMGKYGE